jgi:pimeloyl-ACP methyl ester carboxylesterase
MALPVVLLHAFPLSSGMWEPLRALLPASVELITPDYRGAPAAPAVAGIEPSLDVLADDVATLMRERGIDRAVIGGVSMGGYVTMALLRRHPQLAAALVLADTKAEADDGPTAANRRRIADVLDAEGSTGYLLGLVPSLLGADTKRRRPDLVERVERLVEQTPAAAAAWWERAMAARPGSLDVLAAVRVPALVVRGAEDELATAEQAHAMVDALRDARYVEIAGAGHLSALEAPADFAAALGAFVSAAG